MKSASTATSARDTGSPLQRALNAFEAASHGQPRKDVLRRAAAFWARLGVEWPRQQALGTVEDAEGIGGTVAEACVLEAISEGFSPESISEAAHYAATQTRSTDPTATRLYEGATGDNRPHRQSPSAQTL